jgi:hypothetical protein
MYGHIGALLQEIGFLNPENPEYWMMHIRRLFSRMRLSPGRSGLSGESAASFPGISTTGDSGPY